MTPPGPRVSPREEFDREASGYDRTARGSMPAYGDLHRILLAGIPFVSTRSFRALELGVGTGTFTALLLERFPHVEVVGVDLSPRMIDQARTKLKQYRGRVDLVAGDLAEFQEGPFDVVVSALAIHHLTEPQRGRLFRRIHRALPPGGYFGDADDHLPEDPVFDQRYSQIAAESAPPGRPSPGWNRPQEVWHQHERFDHPSTVTDEVAALGRAGFAHVGVPWRYFGQAVVWAFK